MTDDMHWITGQELREIYTDDLSLDKYDEIRKRPAHSGDCHYCDRCVETEKSKASAEARRDEREKVLLKYQNWIAKEAKMVFCRETKAFIVRLNSKLVDEIESLRTPTTTPAKEQKP